MGKRTENVTLHTRFSFIFLNLFTESACPQLAKANLGGPCLKNKCQVVFLVAVSLLQKKWGTRIVLLSLSDKMASLS